MSRNILLIGDLRSALNYGAVATSDQLILHLKEKLKDDDMMRVIDQRSYFLYTPYDGWSIEINKYREDKLESIRINQQSFGYKLVKLLRKSFFYTIFRKIWRLFSKEAQSGEDRYIPNDWNEYSVFVDKMQYDNNWKYERDNIEWADIVIINAEGAIVNGSSQDGGYKKDARYLFLMMYLSKICFKKVTYVINHCVDPSSDSARNIIKNIYPLCDGIYVREKYSLSKLKQFGIVDNVKFVPDALFGFDTNREIVPSKELREVIDFSQPYICLGDSSGFDSSLRMIDWDLYTVMNNLIRELKEICPQIVFVDGFMGWNSDIERVVEKNKVPRVNLCNCSYQELYYVLKNSQIFISGRWHASILALLSGTPILLWGADSFKTRALYDLFNYPYAFIDIKKLPEQIPLIKNETIKILSSNIRRSLEVKAKELSVLSLSNYQVIE